MLLMFTKYHGRSQNIIEGHKISLKVAKYHWRPQNNIEGHKISLKVINAIECQKRLYIEGHKKSLKVSKIYFLVEKNLPFHKYPLFFWSDFSAIFYDCKHFVEISITHKGHNWNFFDLSYFGYVVILVENKI